MKRLYYSKELLFNVLSSVMRRDPYADEAGI
jgi:hypothetical protein